MATSKNAVHDDNNTKEADLLVRYSLDVDCPYCGAEIDLCDQDEDGFFSTPIFDNRWEDLMGESVLCPDCKKEFNISSVGS